jgi:mannosyl-oligosaccharide alpha-1,2-mannosidase
LLGITQVSKRSKKREYLKLADVFFKSCIETWIKTTTGIAPESWTWTPANDALETRLSQVFNNTLSRAKVNIEETEQTQRAFTISNPLYDLRPGKLL